jgi:tetratricopeptide (TPR) repeat protein
MGQVCQKRQSQSDAAAQQRLVQAADGIDIEPFRVRGNRHFKRKEFAKAVVEYTEALRIAPCEASLWVNRSLAYRQLQLWNEAADDAAQAVALEPDNSKGWYSQAVSLQQMDKIDDALDACKRGLEADSDSQPLLALREVLVHQKKADVRPAHKPDAPKQADKSKNDEAQKPSLQQSKDVSKATDKPSKRPDYSIDYSKWKDFQDSDDEKDEQGELDVGHLRDKDNTLNMSSLVGGNPTDDERLYLVDQFMAAMRETRETTGFANLAKTTLNGIPLGQASSGASNAKLPADYKKPVGVITSAQLAEFNCSNSRLLISLYGDIFDLSSRPDLYGYGPHSPYSGHDVTWGLLIGRCERANLDRFYDIFKVDTEKDLQRNLQVLCHYLVSFRDEFGDPVGRLDRWVAERSLPKPPLDELGDCPQQ